MNRFIALALALAASGAAAQSYPSKPIRVIIPFVAGGSSDIVGRAIAENSRNTSASPAWSRTSRARTAASPPSSSPRPIPTATPSWSARSACSRSTPALFKDLRYHPVRDFAPITLAVTTPNVLITKPQLAAGSLKELVDYMKKNPGKLSYCSSGTGSSDHLTAELLKQASGTDACTSLQGRRGLPDRHHGQPGGLLVPEPRRGDQLHQGRSA
jgi:tripartite-type tricarboxylate transporter receptor subunit TctC